MDSVPQVLAPASSEELAGDAAPLAQAVGQPEALVSLTALVGLMEESRPTTLPAVRRFLARYRERLLEPVELPAIRDAYLHASRGEARELIALDRRVAAQFGRTAFADASRIAGRIQLRRLRPMRHATAVQRYLRAVESGEAAGCHVVVYGMVLALFAFPLRQGLVHYATKTQESLLDSATTGVSATGADRARLLEECLHPVAPAVREVLPSFAPRPV